MFADERRQRRPVNVFENQEETLADVVRIKGGYDVRVHEPCEQLRFASEPF